MIATTSTSKPCSRSLVPLTTTVVNKDHRTSRLLSVLTIFLLRMYENSLVLTWLKRLAAATIRHTTTSTDDDESEDDMLDFNQAKLLRRWVRSRQEWLIRTWAAHLSFTVPSPSRAVDATHDEDEDDHLNIPHARARGRTLTYPITTPADDQLYSHSHARHVDPITSTQSSNTLDSASASASIEAVDEDADANEDEDSAKVNEDEVTEEHQHPPSTVVPCTPEIDSDIPTVTPQTPENDNNDGPTLTLSDYTPIRYSHPHHAWDSNSDSDSDSYFPYSSSPSDEENPIELPVWCPSIPIILIHPCPDSEVVAEAMKLPVQITMYGNRLCVPGLRCYEDENVCRAVWEVWSHEEDGEDNDGGLTEDEDGDEEEDSEGEEDVKSWTYFSGELPPTATGTEMGMEGGAGVGKRPSVKDEEVKTTFWIDEDEDELPDISDWS